MAMGLLRVARLWGLGGPGVLLLAASLPAQETTRVTLSFQSTSSNLVADDTNDTWDVFVHERFGRFTERVSVSSSGEQGNDLSSRASLSADEPPCEIDARWANYGSGFPGTGGVPSFTARSDPVLGSTLTLDLGNSYGNDTAALLFAGYQDTAIPTDKGGTLLVIPVLTLPLHVRWNGTTIDFGIPDELYLCGVEIFLQVLEVDPGAAQGLSFTAGLDLVLGR
jgi:hypothetical protein